VKRFIYLLLVTLSIMAVDIGHAADPVVVRVERTREGWLAWFPHQPNELWAIQASPTSLAGDWFYPPNFTDDGVRIQCFVPNTPQMFFRARRIR